MNSDSPWRITSLERLVAFGFGISSGGCVWFMILSSQLWRLPRTGNRLFSSGAGVGFGWLAAWLIRIGWQSGHNPVGCGVDGDGFKAIYVLFLITFIYIPVIDKARVCVLIENAAL